MSIKALAFSAQHRIAERTGISLQRSHVYEALAASFGFASYASLCADFVFDADPSGRREATPHFDEVTSRLHQLGVPEAQVQNVASELAAVVAGQGLRVVEIDHLIDARSQVSFYPSSPDAEELDLLEEDGFDDAAQDLTGHAYADWDASDFLVAGLEEAAKRGNPKAHYALALILRPEEERQAGASYWHDRLVQGEQLSGAQLEWALAHRAYLEREDSRLRHLLQAARLGLSDACVDAAEELEDPAFLHLIKGSAVRDPARVADVAASLAQIDFARHWCSVAAELGHVDSIRSMIESFDRGNQHRCWTWLHFARLLGKDLTQDRYRLINEDGTDYDDDIGGPGFPIGEDGITLPPLDEEQDAHALQEAEALVARLKVALRALPSA